MAEYIELSQATTLFGDVDARFDTVEGKIPSNASSGNKMVTASDIATKADLVDGKVPAAQLPSFVDDVLEYASTSAFPATGESGKIYVALDTNKTYRWGGSDYVEISESLALGETSSTAYAGDKGKANADAISDIQDLIPSGASTSNKLATASDIPDTSGFQPKTLATTIGSYTTVEGALSGINDGKVDKVTGKGLSTNDYTTADQTALQTTIPLEISQLQASLLTKADVSSIPTALSDLTDDSTHRVVTDTEKTTWSGKQDALTFDNAPTANSNNPVKSGGIKTALDDKMSYADNTLTGVHNWFDGTLVKTEPNTSYSYTDNCKYMTVSTTSNASYRRAWGYARIEPNTDYKIKCYANITSGKAVVDVRNSTDSETIVSSTPITSSDNIELTFNSGSNTEVRIRLFCTYDTVEEGYVAFTDFVLSLASDSYSSFTPYATPNMYLNPVDILDQFTVASGATLDVAGSFAYRIGKLMVASFKISGLTVNSGAIIVTIPRSICPKYGVSQLLTYRESGDSNVKPAFLNVGNGGGEITGSSNISNKTILVSGLTWVIG